MNWKHVHSKDPRKPAIVAALKQVSGAQKITLVREDGAGRFQGNGLAWDAATGQYRRLGLVLVMLEPEDISRRSAS